MQTYALRDPARRLAAFGQSYDRYGRGHLARLIANPEAMMFGTVGLVQEGLAQGFEFAPAFDALFEILLG